MLVVCAGASRPQSCSAPAWTSSAYADRAPSVALRAAGGGSSRSTVPTPSARLDRLREGNPEVKAGAVYDSSKPSQGAVASTGDGAGVPARAPAAPRPLRLRRASRARGALR